MHQIDSDDTFQRFLRGVLARSHHALPYEVVCALVVEVLAAMDPGSPYYVRVNQAAFSVDGQPYTVSFNRDRYGVTLRRGGQAGPILHTFSDRSTAADVRHVIRSLRPGDDCRYHPGQGADLRWYRDPVTP